MSKGSKKEGEEAAKCPKCESDLHLVDKVGQHYCFSCEAYVTPAEAKARDEVEEPAPTPAPAAPEPVKEEKLAKDETVPCPSCGDQTTHVKDSDKFYCYACEQYVSGSGEAIEEPKKTEETAPAETKPERVEEELPEVQKAEAATKVEEPKPEPAPVLVPEPTPMPTQAETVEPAVEKTVPPEEEKQPERLSSEEKRACPYCGCELTYVPKYDRWYCPKCRKYAPKEQPKPVAKAAKKCPTCGNDSQYIEKYQRWYCWTCQKYLPKEMATPVRSQSDQGLLCAQCGRPTVWIPVYGRHYCYQCKKYAPNAEARKEAVPAPAPQEVKADVAKPAAPDCPRCGKTTTWVPKYERYYCYPCQKYVPKESAKKEEEKVSDSKTAPLCSKCGKPTVWIAKYERFYCYPCSKYAPK
jgi:ribosomal protein S27AE